MPEFFHGWIQKVGLVAPVQQSTTDAIGGGDLTSVLATLTFHARRKALCLSGESEWYPRRLGTP